MDHIHTLNIFDIASSIRRFYLKISFSPIHGILLLRHCYLYDIVTSTTLLPLRHCYLYDIVTSTPLLPLRHWYFDYGSYQPPPFFFFGRCFFLLAWGCCCRGGTTPAVDELEVPPGVPGGEVAFGLGAAREDGLE